MTSTANEPPQPDADPQHPDPGSEPQPADEQAPAADPLRSSLTARAWLSLTGLAVLLLLLIVFVAQNTENVAVQFFGWTWHPPLAVAILASLVGGLLVAVTAGSLRIWQLHRRVRRTH